MRRDSLKNLTKVWQPVFSDGLSRIRVGFSFVSQISCSNLTSRNTFCHNATYGNKFWRMPFWEFFERWACACHSWRWDTPSCFLLNLLRYLFLFLNLGKQQSHNLANESSRLANLSHALVCFPFHMYSINVMWINTGISQIILCSLRNISLAFFSFLVFHNNPDSKPEGILSTKICYKYPFTMEKKTSVS